MLSLNERVDLINFVGSGKGCRELAFKRIQNRKSQASDIFKCKAEILVKFESNILEVLNGF